MKSRQKIISGMICLLAMVLSLFLAAGNVFCEDAEAETPEKKPDKIIATDYGSIQEAIDAAKRLEVYHVYIPSGIYYIDKTLDLTGLSWAPVIEKTDSGEVMIPRNKTMIFEGAGRTTVFIARTGDTPAIDLSGCHPVMILRNFVLQTPFVNLGKDGYYWDKGSSVGIFMARIKIPKGGPPSSGGHFFENVTVSGAFPTACVVSWTSEGNRFVNCSFSNTLGDGFIFTAYNREGVKSPYVTNARSTTTEQRFYGTSFSGGENAGVGLRICGAGDVSIHGGFISSKTKGAFGGIYLDGTHHLHHISIRDVRMECAVGHCLYAVGAVSDVLIQGGEWCGMNAENIRHEERVPNKEGAHRYVAFPAGGGRAQNWTIENVRFSRSFEEDPALTLDKSSIKGFTSIRFDALQDSRIMNNNFYTKRQKPGEAGWSGAVDVDGPQITIDKYSRRNFFEVSSRDAVELLGDAKWNEIVALCDGVDDKVPALWMGGESDARKASGLQKYYDAGTRRTYIKPDAGTSLLNLGMTNVFEIKAPRKGDVAFHDGTGFKDGRPRLAGYDGKEWLFFDSALSPKNKNK